jgi:hypothetical protein
MGRFENYILNEASGKDSDFIIRNELTTLLGSKVKTNNKTRWHLRINIGDNPEQFFKNNGYSIEQSDISLSQQYTTYTISKNGNSTYVVNTIRVNSSINQKDLTPEKFNVIGVNLNSSGLYNMVNKSIDNLDYSDNVKSFLKELLNKSSEKGAKFDINSYDLTAAEIRAIANDFGEILCANWSMKNIGFRNIFFPIAINEPLLDFYGVSGSVKYPISVKSGGGSATSLKNIKDLILSNIDNEFSIDELQIIDVIKNITYLSVMDGILETNKTLYTEGIKSLSNITNISVSNMSIKALENGYPIRIVLN